MPVIQSKCSCYRNYGLVHTSVKRHLLHLVLYHGEVRCDYVDKDGYDRNLWDEIETLDEEMWRDEVRNFLQSWKQSLGPDSREKPVYPFKRFSMLFAKLYEGKRRELAHAAAMAAAEGDEEGEGEESAGADGNSGEGEEPTPSDVAATAVLDSVSLDFDLDVYDDCFILDE